MARTLSIPGLFKPLIILGISVLVSAGALWGQCPMCKASAEASIKEGAQTARGLNTGIIYLFATPYLLVGAIGIFWWYKNKKIHH